MAIFLNLDGPPVPGVPAGFRTVQYGMMETINCVCVNKCMMITHSIPLKKIQKYLPYFLFVHFLLFYK